MKIKVNNLGAWLTNNKVVEMEAEDIFTPEPYSNRDGVAETARDHADEALKVCGRIIAVLHERGLLTFEDACNVAGVNFEKVE